MPASRELPAAGDISRAKHCCQHGCRRIRPQSRDVLRSACQLANTAGRAHTDRRLTNPQSAMPRQIKLGMFLRPAAHHIAGWRHPDAWADGGLNFERYVETAKAAE